MKKMEESNVLMNDEDDDDESWECVRVMNVFFFWKNELKNLQFFDGKC